MQIRALLLLVQRQIPPMTRNRADYGMQQTVGSEAVPPRMDRFADPLVCMANTLLNRSPDFRSELFMAKIEF